MGDKTGISWTDATWNPITGCSRISPGCVNCYAEALSLRHGWSKKPWTVPNAAENIVYHPERLEQPLRWKKPRMIFVNSMSDLFHDLIPDEWVARIFQVMYRAPWHTYQVLTKRPERLAALARGGAVLAGLPDWPHIWCGTSIENDAYARRADVLRDVAAAVRFISAEPLLGPLPSLDLAGIHWVITGGESGPEHRPMDPRWARGIRDACEAAGVAYWHKQNGGLTPTSGGHLLDGREYHQFPEVQR